MNIDATLQRAFPAIICGALGTASYFQASGVTEMLGATLLQSAPATRSAPRIPFRRSTKKSGDAILARNPFDSETGPLDGSQAPDTTSRDENTSEVPPEAEGDPLADPLCSFGRVLLIAQADEPEWSFASIESKGGGSKLRRQGDELEGHTLRFIGWNRVWFHQNGKRCQMKMGDKSNASVASSRKPTKKKSRKSKRRRGNKLPPEIAKKITRVSDTEFNIERSAVDQILEKQASLFRRVKLRPVRDGDKVTGLRISRVRRGTLFETIGIKNGDELRSINGFDLTNPQRALEAYGRLRTANKLKLSVSRNGTPVNIEFNIQ